MTVVRCVLKSIGARISHRLCRSVSNMPVDYKEINIKDTDKDEKLPKETNNCNDIQKPEFNNYDCFLPDRKGDIQVTIIGGSDASIYAVVLLKQSRLIKRINVVDVKNLFAGAVFDASHIDTSTRIKHFNRKNVKAALKETNIVALMDEENPNVKDLNAASQFDATSAYVREMAEQMVQFSSNSLVAVFTRPVTATLPMVSEIYKHAGWWDPDRIIGSTALDRMRIEAITANLLDLNPAFLSVPMVGGADSNSIVPLLSCASPISGFTDEQLETLLQYLRNADKDISNDSKGSSLSEGAAAAKLILALASGLSGFENIFSSGYVRSNVLPVCRFFTTELQFGTGGVHKNLGLPKMSPLELLLVEQAITQINECIEMATKAIQCNRYFTVKKCIN